MSYIVIIFTSLTLTALATTAASHDFKPDDNNIISKINHFGEIDTKMHFGDIGEKSKLIDMKIEKGLNYLYENQLPGGEFPVYLSLSPDMTQSVLAVSTPFDTGLIIHTLNIADNNKEIVNEMKNKSIIFLLNNMEQHHVWRFFGRNDYIPPDIDTTSVVFAALIESGVDISDESLDYMLNYRTTDDIFYTWMNSEEWISPSNPYYNLPFLKVIDHNVNINALYAYSLRNRAQNGVVEYLKKIIKNESFIDGSEYYPSPYVFTYLITKANFEGNFKELKPYLNDIKKYLLRTQNPDGSWGNDLETALAVNSLINIGFEGNQLEKAIENILYNQEQNGSWGLYNFYIQPEDSLRPTTYYGSRELTTSINLEALIKYKKEIPMNKKFHRRQNEKRK